MAIWPEALAPYNSRLGRLADRHKPPGYVDATGGIHWLGTDHQGRDVLSRVIYGAQVSLTVGYSGVIIGGIFGIALGLLAGYRGGKFDQVAMRVVDAQLNDLYRRFHGTALRGIQGISRSREREAPGWSVGDAGWLAFFV